MRSLSRRKQGNNHGVSVRRLVVTFVSAKQRSISTVTTLESSLVSHLKYTTETGNSCSSNNTCQSYLSSYYFCRNLSGLEVNV